MAIELEPSSDLALPQSVEEEAVAYRPFRYVDDPICVGAMAIYAVNRWLLRPHHIGGWPVHDYLNDLLCLPLFLPIILRVQSALGIRRHHLPPTMFEVLYNWAIFSVLFEVVLPRMPAFNSTGDPWDCVAYLVGGGVAYGWWNRGVWANNIMRQCDR